MAENEPKTPRPTPDPSMDSLTMPRRPPLPPGGKYVKDTMVTMHKIAQPAFIDGLSQTLLLGEVLKWMDLVTCLSAEKHSGYPSVTVSADDIQIDSTVKVGDLVVIKAMVNKSYNKSMEVGCVVTAEDLKSREKPRHVCSAYFTFVSKDKEGKTVTLPPVVPESYDERTRYDLAEERKKIRMMRKIPKPTVPRRVSVPASFDDFGKELALDNPQSTSLSATTLGMAAAKFKGFVTGTTATSRLSWGGENQKVKVSETVVETVEIVLPSHTQHHGTTFGGQIMEWMANVATISAYRVCTGGAPTMQSVDDIHFISPSYVGDRIILYSRVNQVFDQIMEVGCRVEAQCVGGPVRHINSAFFMFVANDSKVAKLEAETDEDYIRMQQAGDRRRWRLDRATIRSIEDNRALSVPWDPEIGPNLILSNVQNLLKLYHDPALWEVNTTRALKKEDLRLYLKEDPSKRFIYIKAEGVVEVHPKLLFHFLAMPGMRDTWDPIYKSSKMLVSIDSNNFIARTNLRATEHTPEQELLLLTSHREHEANRSVIAIRSVSMDEHPPQPGVVRSDLYCAGFVVEADRRGARFSYILSGMGRAVLDYVATDFPQLASDNTSVILETIRKLKQTLFDYCQPDKITAMEEELAKKLELEVAWLKQMTKTLESHDATAAIRQQLNDQELQVVMLEKALGHCRAMMAINDSPPPTNATHLLTRIRDQRLAIERLFVRRTGSGLEK
eukprot:comp17828_c0_seq1/m.17963 comp17828_c0_seq1/g.17963  ORF comp17828_c0_seq1/g.17963 comp17828_c0_seq1/m.17963 type:complete len:727 (-) comp17828_c0_seq1:303-2483(-)